jgi:alkanesulfonate monooxygenase SsuD/methylene tetrahydromethanopterin reductase-like flavin-dependent oxidoreductase (luciferase family)
MVGLNVFAADTEEEARLLRTSAQQSILSLRRGRPGKLPPPVADFEDRLSPLDREILDRAQSCSVVGAPDAVRTGVAKFAQRTGADEVMIVSHIFDHDARLRSLEITAQQVIAQPLGV